MKSLIFSILLLLSHGAWGSPELSDAPQIETQLLAQVAQAQPGESFQVGVHFKIEKDWHIYWKKAGEAGFPTDVSWSAPDAISFSDILWPRPLIFKEPGNITTIGYKDETMLLANVNVPATWPPGEDITLRAGISWLACKKVCIPGNAQLLLTIPTGSERKSADAPTVDLITSFSNQVLAPAEEALFIEEYESQRGQSKLLDAVGSGQTQSLSFITALLFAFLGGLLLNLMPCVLPVLSIKILRFAKQAQQPRRTILKETSVFSMGVLLSFVALALAVVGIKTLGHEIGWGFQFQEPRFLIFLTTVVFGFALSLFGVFEFSFLVPAAWEKKTRQTGLAGPFWEGMLATLLATPCTAPFLGPALGFSFSQSALTIILFFIVIGIGLSLPYMMLAAFPKWSRWIPKPGAWTNTFKELMGFPLVATGIWLLWVLGRQAGNAAVIGTLIFLFVLSLGLWAMRQWKWNGLIFIPLLILSYVQFVEPPLRPYNNSPSSAAPSHIDWQPYSLDAFEESLSLRDPIFIDFTADWCLTCQVNKKGALNSKRVAAAFKDKGVVAYRADWTHRDTEIGTFIKKLGRSGVPVYVFFFEGDVKNPVILPEILTEEIILDALER